MKIPRSQRFWRRLAMLPDAPAGKTAPTTWYRHPESWGMAESVAALDVGPFDIYHSKPPGFKRSGAIPAHSSNLELVFIYSLASIPLSIQTVASLVFPRWRWGFVTMYLVYHLSFVYIGVKTVARFQRYTQEYGTLNEEHQPRTILSDSHVKRLALSSYLYLCLRTACALLCAYRKELHPLDGLGLLSLPKICLWFIAIEYLFYCYHRCAHDPQHFPWLWRIHNVHHVARAPTALQSILASDEQELIEVVIIPVLASLLVPLSFPEQWLGMCQLFYTETMGHTGIRAYWITPLLGPFLKLFDMEISIEDHDLHHRHGLSGRSYGKQSRIFDQIFGTCEPRVEVIEARGRTGREPGGG